MFRCCSKVSSMESQPSPLLSVLRNCSVKEQTELAEIARTTRNYLYQVATLQRTPRVGLAKRISEATGRLHVRTLGRVPKISVDALAEMAEVKERAKVSAAKVNPPQG